MLNSFRTAPFNKIVLLTYSHNCWTNGVNSWFWLRGRMEHLYGATVAGKLKYCIRNKPLITTVPWQVKTVFSLIYDCCFEAYRPLLIFLPDAEWMLKDRVHDSADAKRRLNYIRNNFLHCGKNTDSCFPIDLQLYEYKVGLMWSLTVQGFLKPPDTDHVFGQSERLALCHKAKHSEEINNQRQIRLTY